MFLRHPEESADIDNPASTLPSFFAVAIADQILEAADLVVLCALTALPLACWNEAYLLNPGCDRSDGVHNAGSWLGTKRTVAAELTVMQRVGSP